MPYSDTQKHDHIESTATELQRDENTEDSGISEEDSDSVGKPVNKSKTSSVITKPNKSKKTKTHENKNNSAGESSKKLETGENSILVNKAYYKAQKDLDRTLLQNMRNTSKKSKECIKEYDDLLNIVADLESKTDSAKKATKLVTTAINNHEKLLQNNNLKSKCMGASGIVGGTGGTVLTIVGTGASHPIIAGIAVVLGGVITVFFAGMAIRGFYNLYKKPNSTVKSVDVEQGVPEASKCLPI